MYRIDGSVLIQHLNSVWIVNRQIYVTRARLSQPVQSIKDDDALL